MSEEWITTPKVIFNGLSPLEVLDSEQGKTKVLDIIQRIAYGDFS
jgi:uncharacterized protein (DUF2384 family)